MNSSNLSNNWLVHCFWILLFLISCAQDPANQPGTNLYPVRQNGKWGYIDDRAQIAIPPVFDTCLLFQEGFAIVDRGHGYEFMDKKGNFPFGRDFRASDGFSDGLALVLGIEENKEYFIDTTGKKVLYVESDSFGRASRFFSEGLNLASFEDGFVSYIDKSGKVVIKTNFLVGESFHDGFATLWTYDNPNEPAQYAMINKRGEIVSWGATGYSEGLMSVIRNGETVFVDSLNNIVLVPENTRYSYWNFENGFCKFVSDEGKHGYINRKGKIICPPIYDYSHGFKNSFCAVELNGKWGFINEKGELCIPIQFDWVYNEGFIGKFARVRLGQTTGYIDRHGNFVWKDN